VVAGSLAGCGGDKPGLAAANDESERTRAMVEYQLLQAELQLARQSKPYLMFDWAAGEIVIKLKGTPVTRFAMRLMEDDSLAVHRFQKRFLGKEMRAVRGVTARRLYTAEDQHPDSVLAVVGKVLSVDPEVLQREVPGWFELGWSDGIVLEVHVEPGDQPSPAGRSHWQRLRRGLARPFGGTRLRVRMDSRDALTLYRVAEPGVPTLVPISF
jgi:hypothetical protein